MRYNGIEETPLIIAIINNLYTINIHITSMNGKYRLTHGTSAVRDITEGVNFTARGREAHEGSKIYPEVISRTAEVPWVNHFVA